MLDDRSRSHGHGWNPQEQLNNLEAVVVSLAHPLDEAELLTPAALQELMFLRSEATVSLLVDAWSQVQEDMSHTQMPLLPVTDEQLDTDQAILRALELVEESALLLAALDDGLMQLTVIPTGLKVVSVDDDLTDEEAKRIEPDMAAMEPLLADGPKRLLETRQAVLRVLTEFIHQPIHALLMEQCAPGGTYHGVDGSLATALSQHIDETLAVLAAHLPLPRLQSTLRAWITTIVSSCLAAIASDNVDGGAPTNEKGNGHARKHGSTRVGWAGGWLRGDTAHQTGSSRATSSPAKKQVDSLPAVDRDVVDELYRLFVGGGGDAEGDARESGVGLSRGYVRAQLDALGRAVDMQHLASPELIAVRDNARAAADIAASLSADDPDPTLDAQHEADAAAQLLALADALLRRRAATGDRVARRFIDALDSQPQHVPGTPTTTSSTSHGSSSSPSDWYDRAGVPIGSAEVVLNAWTTSSGRLLLTSDHLVAVARGEAAPTMRMALRHVASLSVQPASFAPGGTLRVSGVTDAGAWADAPLSNYSLRVWTASIVSVVEEIVEAATKYHNKLIVWTLE
jgi:hypothetical protein